MLQTGVIIKVLRKWTPITVLLSFIYVPIKVISSYWYFWYHWYEQWSKTVLHGIIPYLWQLITPWMKQFSHSWTQKDKQCRTLWHLTYGIWESGRKVLCGRAPCRHLFIKTKNLFVEFCGLCYKHYCKIIKFRSVHWIGMLTCTARKSCETYFAFKKLFFIRLLIWKKGILANLNIHY